MGYKAMRYRIATLDSPTKNKPVIVFDNVAKLTPQKIIFLRHLIEEKHFQFIAIAEKFLRGKDVLLLRAQLIPTETISLHHLSTKDVSTFISYYAEKHHMDLSDSYVDDLTALAGGYPLGMIGLIKSFINKS